MKSIIDLYLDSLSVNEISKQTIKNYRQKLNCFDLWLQKKNKNIIDATNIEIDEFLFYLKKNNSSASTRNVYLSALKSFYIWCKERNIIEKNPSEYIKSAKIQKRSPEYYNIDEMMEILEAIGKRNIERNKAIILCGAICGLRKSEIINLNLYDYQNGVLRIIGKGNKERFVSTSKKVEEAIVQYLKVRPNKGEALFISERGNRISSGSIDNIMFSLSRATNQHVHMHKFRHTAASLAYQSSKDIIAVQQMLGHENLKTTQVYTHIDREQIKRTIESNPLNDLI